MHDPQASPNPLDDQRSNDQQVDKSLRGEVASAGKWSAITTVATTVLQFAKTITLANLLSPTEIGLFGMAALAVNLFTTLGDGGMANAIIYKQTTDNLILSSIHWINVIIGVIVSLFVLLSAPLVAAFFQNPSLVGMLSVMAIGPILISWTIVGQAVLRTELKFSSICVIKIASALASLAVSVWLAMRGHGVFAFVYGNLVSCIVATLLTSALAIDYSRPKFSFQRSGLGEYVRFGGFQLGERFVNYFGANIDYIIIGRVLGEEALGVYRIAYELIVLPLSRINPIVTQVVLPGFAKMKDPQRVRGAYLQVLKLLATITVPCLLGLWAIAPLLIEVAYDERYAAAVGLVRILVLVGVLKTLSNPIGVAIVALGRPDIGFWWNVGVLTASIPLFSLLAPNGSEAVAWGYVGLTICCFLILNGPILRLLLPIPFSDVLKQVYGPILLSCLMAITVVGLKGVFRDLASPTINMFALVGFGILTYALLFVWWDRQYANSIYALIVKGK